MTGRRKAKTARTEKKHNIEPSPKCSNKRDPFDLVEEVIIERLNFFCEYYPK